MKNQKGNAGLAIILIISLFMIMAVTIIAVTSSKEEKTKSLSTEEWCEVGTVNPDGSITYNGSAGETELVAFATASGPKLMAKCE